jgi:hypothetical protein
VIAKIIPKTQQVTRRVIVGGHVDAAYEWTYNYLGTVFLWISHVIQFFALFGVMISTYLPLYLRHNIVVLCIHSVCLLFSLSVIFNNNFFFVVPGANDNLSGCFAAISLARYFAQDAHKLQNTELDVLLTGCEEAGLRGAKSFAKKHMDELLDSRIETVFVEFETLRDRGHLSIVTSL